MSLTTHPNTPRRLAKAYQRAGTYHKLADELHVNVYHVYQLLVHGKEPVNPSIREKLFLPRRPRRARTERKPLPEHRRWWRRQDRETIIKQLYEINKDKLP